MAKTIRISKANPTLRALSSRSHGHVVRSAHVGNVGAYNVAGALGRVAFRGGKSRTTGVHLQLYDRTTPAQDENYHPGRIIYNGRDLILFENSERLTPFMFLSSEQRQAVAAFLGVNVKQIPENLATLHYRVMRQVARGAKVQTFSQYLVGKERAVRSILTHLSGKGHWEIFDRYVDHEGNIRKLVGIQEDELVYENGIRVKKKDAVTQTLRANHELAHIVANGHRPAEDVGLLVSVKAVTLLSAVLEVHGKRKPQSVHHASGPDMINYVMSEAYGKEFAKLAGAMEDYPYTPPSIDFRVFSLLPMQIMSPRSNPEQSRLTQRLATLLQRKKQVERAKYALRYADATQKQAILARTRPLETKINTEIGRVSDALAPFIAPQDPTIRKDFYQKRWLYDHRYGGAKYDYELPAGLAVRTIGELDNLLNQIKRGKG